MNEKNNEIINEVEYEDEGNAMVPADDKKEKLMAIGKKVGKVLLAGLALGGSYCLGKWVGKRSVEADLIPVEVVDVDFDVVD